MSEDSSNNNITQSINSTPPSVEAVDFISYLLGIDNMNDRDNRASPINFTNSTNNSYIPIRRRYAMPIEPNLDTSSNETTSNIINNTSDTSSNETNLDTERDLYFRFLEDILQLPPLTGLRGGYSNQNNIRDLLRQTLVSDKNPIKQVLSDEGEKCIKYINFDSQIHTDITCCPITMKEFKDGDVIAQLPCGHTFDKTAILKWLKEEKAECPICRAKLKSKEKKEDVALQRQTTQTTSPLRPPPLSRSNNIRYSFGPPRLPQRGRVAHFRRLMQSRQEREEEEELQAALLASLEDEYMPGNEKISSNKHSNDSELYSEDDLSSSDEMDQID